MSTTWEWERTDPLRGGAAGDLSKLFRNESVKEPGLFGVNAPSAGATLLAREVIQNSWDAARELREEIEESGGVAPLFRIDFEFEDLIGDRKANLIADLDLGSLGERAASVRRRDLGLAESDCLSRLSDDTPLSVLEIRESGTTGMYGPFTGAKSKLYLALISVGYTAKLTGSGGSYGYGKAGLIRASSIRTVVAYTCFREREDDPSITRRLLGMTYWGQHEIDDESFTGFSRFGSPTEGGVEPFVNDDADRMAERLGLELRSAERDEALGTTFLLIEPSVTAVDVNRAVERNWWPAILEGQFTSTVTDAEGTRHRPRPKKDADLKTFIRAFEVATTPQDNSSDEEKQVRFNSWKSPAGTQLELGALGLVADKDGWSWATELAGYGDDVSVDGGHRSLVALIRGPRMIVEYLDVGRQPPFVRGAFVAADDVDDLLRQTEPKAHDAWQSRIDDEEVERGIDRDAPHVAKTIDNRIKNAVRAYRNSLRPPVPKPEDVRLPLLRDLFRSLVSGSTGSRKPPPPPGPREVSIQIDQRIEVDTDDDRRIRMAASVRFALSQHVEADSSAVRLGLSYKFVEDGRAGARCPLLVEAPDGFQPSDDGLTFDGILTHEPVDFRVLSDAYSGDWTAQLVASGELASETPATSDDEAAA